MKELVEKWAADAAKQLEDRVPTTGMFKQLVVGVIANPKGEYPINFVECKVFNDTFVAYALVETIVPDAIYEESITICKGFAGQPVGAFDSQLRIRQIEMELIRAMRFIFPNLFSGPKQQLGEVVPEAIISFQQVADIPILGKLLTVNEVRTKILGWKPLPPSDSRGDMLLDMQ